MGRYFSQIFWGLLLVVLDFNLRGFDVLPDVAGYFLVVLGCRGLASVARGFSIASVLAVVLAVAAVVQMVIRIHGGWFEYLLRIVDCGMMWCLLGGVMELARTRERPDLAERASHSRIAYVALMVLATVTGLIVRREPDLARALAMLFVIGILLLLALILFLLHRVKNELTR